MQVSWINPEDVAALAESLRTPPQQPPARGDDEPLSLLAADDIDEGPVEDAFAAPVGPSFEFPKAAFAAPSFQEAPAPPVHESEDASDPGPDLQALRQRLQQIRERAMGAGLLPTQPSATIATEPPPAEAAPPEPEPAPDPQPGAEEPPPRERAAFEVPLGSAMARLEAFANWTHRLIGTSSVFVVDHRGDLLWGPQDQAGLVLSTLMAMNASARSSALAAYGSTQTMHQVMPSGQIMTVVPCQTRLGMMQVAVAAAEPLAPDEAELMCDALKSAMDAEG